jgi:antagonist of KipI
MEIFEVIQPGAYTTVQDSGRFNYQQFGVPVCGVVDSFSYRVANALVGNDKGQAVLEATVFGPTLKVLQQGHIAVTGGNLTPHINNNPLPMWQSIAIHPDDILQFKGVKSGCRAYIAVTGGIDVPLVMGSRSTYVAGKIGGMNGRPLMAGDRLKKGEEMAQPEGHVPSELIPEYSDDIEIRVILGPQDNYFSDAIETFFASEFTVSTKADRMGYRLEGNAIMHKNGVDKSIISEPSVPGGIQVPPDGQPIILLVEQTVGGYTKIATVISSDIGKVGQAKPGDRICFRQVDIEKAHQIVKEEEQRIEQITKSLRT